MKHSKYIKKYFAFVLFVMLFVGLILFFCSRSMANSNLIDAYCTRIPIKQTLPVGNDDHRTRFLSFWSCKIKGDSKDYMVLDHTEKVYYSKGNRRAFLC